MKQKLIVLLIVIVGLGMLVLWARAPEPVAPTKRLEVTGYASAEQLKAAESQGMFAPQQTIEHPVDGVTLGEGPDEVKLVRRGTGEDTSWELTKPIEAVAVSFRVERIVKLFEKTRNSIHSKVIQPEDLPLFDLEPERRIRLTLTRGEEVWNDVDLFVGRVEGSDQTRSAPGTEDTWVMVRGESPLRVYRLGGLNIREAVALTLSELRDKRVFRFKPEQMKRVTVLGPDGAQVTLERAPDAEAAAQAVVNARWTLTQPEGFVADSTVDSLLKRVVNLRAQSFTPIDKKAALDLSRWLLLTLSSEEGELARLRVSTEAPRAVVEGREELIELDERTATTLRVKLDSLRDRTLVPLSPADITQVEINNGRGQRLNLVRRDDTWRVSARGRSAPGQPKDFLKQLVSAKAARFAELQEREQALAALGSSPPTLTVMAEGASPLVVSIQPLAQGDEAEGFWARTQRGTERPELMWLKNHLRQRLLARFDDLRRKTFFDLKREDIRRIELRNISGQQSILERQTSEEALSLVGLADTEVVKTATVNTLLNTLTALRAKTFEPKRRAQDVGLTKVATHELLVTRFDGSTVHLTLASKPEGDVVFVRASTGPLKGMIATIPNFQALNLTKNRAQLVDP